MLTLQVHVGKTKVVLARIVLWYIRGDGCTDSIYVKALRPGGFRSHTRQWELQEEDVALLASSHLHHQNILE